MHSRRPTVLITGFGPFPGVPANATTVLVPRLARAAARALPGVRVEAEVLATEWRAAPQRLADLVARLKPVLTLHFGVSSRADGFVVEARGRNAAAGLRDACESMPEAPCIAVGGPEFLPATIPAWHIVERLRRRGLPAELSRDAGAYVCNALLYRSLELGRAAGRGQRSGFIHIPDRLAGASSGVAPAMPSRKRRAGAGPGALDLDQAVDGGLEIIAAALGRPPLPEMVQDHA